MQIPVLQKVMEANDLLAEELRAEFQKAGLFVINLMGSPGCRKDQPGRTNACSGC